MVYQHGSVSNVYLHQMSQPRKCNFIVLPKFRLKNAEETLTRQCLWLTGWRPCIWNRLHTLDYLFPASKFYILDNKYPNFQSREPVRFRSRDDPRAGQSNIVVSRSPVQISESAHGFFFCFLWCFLRSRQLHLLDVRLTDFYSFFFHDHSCSKENRCKLQRMKNGFHQNALFTISLQTQVLLR